MLGGGGGTISQQPIVNDMGRSKQSSILNKLS